MALGATDGSVLRLVVRQGVLKAGLSVFLVVVALVASSLPALRATQVDPLIALRSE